MSFFFYVLSMVPNEREYCVLSKLKKYSLGSQILEGRPSPMIQVPESDMKEIQNAFGVTTAQAKAISSSILPSSKISLIQGYVSLIGLLHYV